MLFAVSNQKGGVGKTTSVINLGVNLAQAGFKTLLVDIDPQANLTSGLGMQRPEKQKTSYDLLTTDAKAIEVIQSTRIANLAIITSHIDLAGAEIELVNALSRETKLRTKLETVKQNYDYILIDCPPSLGLLTLNALTAADKIIVPVQAEYFALEGLGQLITTINLVKTHLNPTIEIGGVIATMVNSRTNLGQDVFTELKNVFKDKVFSTIIPRNIKLSEAPSHGLAITEYDKNSNGAKAYANLTKEFSTRFPVAKTRLNVKL